MNLKIPLTFVFSFSIAKGRFGNNIFHLINLLPFCEKKLLFIDSTYRISLRNFGLINLRQPILFIPFLDRIYYTVHIFFCFFSNLIRFDRNFDCSFPSQTSVNLFFIKFQFVFGELLSKDFSPCHFERFVLKCQYIPIDVELSSLPCACHIRLGDFKSHNKGFNMYNKYELQDVINFTSLTCKHHELSIFDCIFTDDPPELLNFAEFPVDYIPNFRNQTYLDDWQDIKNSYIVLTNASTFAITAFLLGVHCSILVIPQRMYDKFLQEKDPFFLWLRCLKMYKSLVFLAKPYMLDDALSLLHSYQGFL